jgi:hypothetical protein
MVTLVFHLLLAAAVVHAMRFGGAPERLAAALFVVATIATIAIAQSATFQSMSVPLLLIDCAMFAALTGLSVVADRYWPMWLAALELIAVATHLAKAYRPSIVPDAYWIVTNQLAWVMVAVLVLATARHRDRLKAGLPEPSWSRRPNDEGDARQ